LLGLQPGEEAVDPIARLTSEHQILFGALHALEVYVGGVARGQWTREDELGEFVTFFRGFVGGLRTAEEELLIDAMAARGFAKGSGPIGRMLAETEQGRRLLNRLDFFAHNVRVWTDGQRKAVANVACDYARLLRAHLREEEGVLFPLARLRLMHHVVAELASALSDLESQHGGRQRREQLERLADQLVSRYARAPSFGALPVPVSA
jgi:hemerythrin-like domain-containing protein